LVTLTFRTSPEDWRTNRLELPAGAEDAVASDKADLPTWLIGEGNGEAPIINLGAA